MSDEADAIKLACRCGCRGWVHRKDAADLPAIVETVVTDLCPECDTGDFGSERYFNAAGDELNSETWQPIRL